MVAIARGARFIDGMEGTRIPDSAVDWLVSERALRQVAKWLGFRVLPDGDAHSSFCPDYLATLPVEKRAIFKRAKR
jgi:hypothetical protein